MYNRIWTYTLVVLVFVLPICTVTAMKLDPQSELRGGHHRPCNARCQSENRVVGSCSNNDKDCEDGCGTVISYPLSYCKFDGLKARNTLFNCATEVVLVRATVVECWCGEPEDEDLNLCTSKRSDNMDVPSSKCVYEPASVC